MTTQSSTNTYGLPGASIVLGLLNWINHGPCPSKENEERKQAEQLFELSVVLFWCEYTQAVELW